MQWQDPVFFKQEHVKRPFGTLYYLTLYYLTLYYWPYTLTLYYLGSQTPKIGLFLCLAIERRTEGFSRGLKEINDNLSNRWH
jgi:hypothetical protein